MLFHANYWFDHHRRRHVGAKVIGRGRQWRKWLKLVAIRTRILCFLLANNHSLGQVMISAAKYNIWLIKLQLTAASSSARFYFALSDSITLPLLLFWPFLLLVQIQNEHLMTTASIWNLYRELKIEQDSTIFAFHILTLLENQRIVSELFLFFFYFLICLELVMFLVTHSW